MGDLSWVEYVPRSAAANLRWRVRVREAAALDAGIRRALYDAAMDDLMFFLAAFCWVMEPRARIKTLPFIPWPHQVEAFQRMDRAISDAERSEFPIVVTMPKSRAQGATYGYICLFLRRFLRDRMFSAGLVTRNEKLVDSATDKDTLLWKVGWQLDMLPWWMRPAAAPPGYVRSLADHTITNPQNGSIFTGFSATGDVGRGGRMTVFALDEFGSEEFISAGKDYKVMSSISHVTNCIFMVSTFGSDAGVFYKAATDPENPFVVRLDWKENPAQTRCAYVMRDGRLTAVRPEDQARVDRYAKTHARQLRQLERMGYVVEGRFRSPWYDAYCLLPGATPRFVARELDMDPRGAVGKVFSREVLEEAAKKCQVPAWQGKAVFDSDTLALKGLIEVENGPLKLWFRPGLDDAPPWSQYAVGCDISAGGTGEWSSNSVACGLDMASGRQVMEYVVRGMQPAKFARVCMGLAKWLRNAYLGWETTGPTGTTFGKEVLEVVCYGNVYFRDVEQLGSQTKSRNAGWANNREQDKAELFEALCLSLEEGSFTALSEDLVRECGEYEWVNGKIVHRPSNRECVSEKAHGDRCVAAGVADLLRRDRSGNTIDKAPSLGQTTPVGSIAWFEERDRIRTRQAKRDDEVDFGVGVRHGSLHGLLAGTRF